MNSHRVSTAVTGAYSIRNPLRIVGALERKRCARALCVDVRAIQQIPVSVLREVMKTIRHRKAIGWHYASFHAATDSDVNVIAIAFREGAFAARGNHWSTEIITWT